MISGPIDWIKHKGDRMRHLVRTKRLMWMHLGKHPLEWEAGPIAIRASVYHAATKPWNRNRRPLRRGSNR